MLIIHRKLNCPVSKDVSSSHHIKIKELIKLKLEENELKEYICWICHKGLIHQKVVALKTCGHVMCKECVKQYCGEKQ